MVAPRTGYFCEDTNECEGVTCDAGKTCVDVAAPSTGYSCDETNGCKNVTCGPAGSCSDETYPATGRTCTYQSLTCSSASAVFGAEEVLSPEGLWGTITDVNVSLDITHPYVQNFAAWVKFGGQTATLVDRLCEGNDNIDATFDDEATGGPACTGDPTISGTVTPGTSLDVFDGMPVGADWNLDVTDYYPQQDDGILNEWCVDITSTWTTPVEFTTTPKADTALVGDEGGVVQPTESCPWGQFISGFNLSQKDGRITGVQPVCSVNEVFYRSLSSDHIVVLAGSTLSKIGDPAGNYVPLLCENSTYLGENSKFLGGIFAGYDTALSMIQLRCGTMNSDGSMLTLNENGPRFGQGVQGSFATEDCATGAATGASISIADGKISNIVLTCAKQSANQFVPLDD